jgi:hypothetical protein
LCLCALGAHPRDPKQDTGTGKMTSFTHYFASNSKSIQTLRIYRMSTKCWPWPSTANTERLSRCTRKFVHHVHAHASHSHFDKHILTLERTPTRIMTRMRRGANGGFLDLWTKLPYLDPCVPRMAMVSNKELPRSLAHADHHDGGAICANTAGSDCNNLQTSSGCTLLQPTPTSSYR